MKRQEEALHKAVVTYLKTQYPRVRLRSGLEGFHLSKIQARLNQQIQWRPGAPDIMIFKVKDPFVGLFIELKTSSPYLKKSGNLRKNDHLKRQDDWHTYLRNEGWHGGFATGFEEAKLMIDKYLR